MWDDIIDLVRHEGDSIEEKALSNLKMFKKWDRHFERGCEKANISKEQGLILLDCIIGFEAFN